MTTAQVGSYLEQESDGVDPKVKYGYIYKESLLYKQQLGWKTMPKKVLLENLQQNIWLEQKLLLEILEVF